MLRYLQRRRRGGCPNKVPYKTSKNPFRAAPVWGKMHATMNLMWLPSGSRPEQKQIEKTGFAQVPKPKLRYIKKVGGMGSAYVCIYANTHWYKYIHVKMIHSNDD